LIGGVVGGSCCTDFRLSPLLLDVPLLEGELLHSVKGGGPLGGLGSIWIFGEQSVNVPP